MCDVRVIHFRVRAIHFSVHVISSSSTSGIKFSTLSNLLSVHLIQSPPTSIGSSRPSVLFSTLVSSHRSKRFAHFSPNVIHFSLRVIKFSRCVTQLSARHYVFCARHLVLYARHSFSVLVIQLSVCFLCASLNFPLVNQLFVCH